MARNVQVNRSGKAKGAGKGKNAADPRAYGYTEREWRRINAQEERERRAEQRLITVFILLLVLTCFMGYLVWYFVFRSHDYQLSMQFDSSNTVYGTDLSSGEVQTASGFAQDLCVVDSDQNTQLLSISALGAGLFDLTNETVIYAKDIYTTRSPASLTKIMTCLVALKYGNPDDIVTVTESALDIEYGSSVCDIKPGDKLSLKQLLYGLLVASGNDAAMTIAEHVGGGSIDNFVYMMNEEARRIGATRTHFTNPHGLTDPEHYTCIYDLYLMFLEAMKYDLFMDMINRKNYYAEYQRGDGSAVAVTWESTNHYFTGESPLPENAIIYGGKTGTTEDAGACLFLLVKDLYGNPYIAGLMKSSDKDVLYTEMNGLLSLVNYS